MNEIVTGGWPIGRCVEEVLEFNVQNGWFEESRSWGMTIALLHSEVSEMLEAYRDHEFRVPYKITEKHDTSMRVMDAKNEDALIALHRFKVWHRRVVEDPSAREGLGEFILDDGERMALARVGVLKPEGFGSELADVYIRWCDTVHRLGLKPSEFADTYASFALNPDDVGAAITKLHAFINNLGTGDDPMGNQYLRMRRLLNVIFSVADTFDVRLEDEYKFKIAYNRTRGHKHGGKLA